MALEELVEIGEKPLATILKAGGISGLIAIMGMGFLMFVIYQGQNSTVDLEKQVLAEQVKTNLVLSDIRYSIQASKGITFRNTPSSASSQ